MSREREREREHDHEARRIGSDTNSDDPRMLMSRIFIGNLPTDRVGRMEIEDKYKKYGKIIGEQALILHSYTELSIMATLDIGSHSNCP